MRFVAFALLCACGDNVVGIPFEEFEAAATRAKCERFVRCGLAPDIDACTGFFRKRPDKDLARAIDAQIIRYSGPAAEQCLAALAAQPCDTSSREARIKPPACDEMFGGQLEGRAPCRFDEECESGICIRAANCTEACCTGTCRNERQPAFVGGSCTLDVDCAPDTFCGMDFTCQPLGPEGALCTGDHECEYGSACISPTPIMPGNCRKQPLLGETCLYQRCAELGAKCVAGSCVPLTEGSQCSSSKDCLPFMQCVGSVCTRTPKLGEPCTLGCAGEAFCDLDTQRCAVPRANLEPCAADDQCASQFCDEGILFEACADRPACF